MQPDWQFVGEVRRSSWINTLMPMVFSPYSSKVIEALPRRNTACIYQSFFKCIKTNALMFCDDSAKAIRLWEAQADETSMD